MRRANRYRPSVEPLEGRLTPATLPDGFSEVLVTSALVNPTAMAFAPDGRLFVAEQGGRLRVVRDGSLLPTPFVSLNVNSAGERGLLGIAFDPDFATNAFVYLYYTTATAPLHNRVSRFTAVGDVAATGSEVVLLDLDNLSAATNHNGGALHFGADGRLYVATGENANPPLAQSLDSRLGKILRINSDGTIPADNPFFTAATGANRAIWALGLRNPFTFAFQPDTGRMFINDVGQNTLEEINQGVPGGNFGWPTTEGPTTDPRFVGPVFAYPHGSGTQAGCAITGGDFYNPETATFPADHVGDYFFADFCNGWVRRLDPATGSVSLFATGIDAPVDLKVATDGSLWYLARGFGGPSGLFRVTSDIGPAPQGRVRLAAAAYDVGEAGGAAQVTVLRTGDPSTTVSVAFAVAAGSATSGTDFTATSGTLEFAPYETSKIVAIPILQDGTVENPETLTLTIADVGGAMVVAEPSSSTITLRDDDGLPGAAERFVAQAYLDVLGRPADAGGRAFWAGLLGRGLPSDQFALALASSREARGRFVEEQYLLLLGRPADATGRDAFVAFLEAGGVADQVRTALLGSPEYFQVRGGGTATGFVEVLYRDVLGRAADAGGRAFFTGALEAGLLRPTLAAALLGTDEAKRRLVAGVYRQLLRRDAEAAALTFWSDVLRRGLREEVLVAVLVGSAEYRSRLG